MTPLRITGITIAVLALWAGAVFGFWWMYSIGVHKNVLLMLGLGWAFVLILVPAFLAIEMGHRR